MFRSPRSPSPLYRGMRPFRPPWLALKTAATRSGVVAPDHAALQSGGVVPGLWRGRRHGGCDYRQGMGEASVTGDQAHGGVAGLTISRGEGG
mmetsp:Transcript_3239/g.5977  ORF Transcript_3239/g.5977 Transcript_3239/m.5977 type:complete len:92 (-) Transcript_3239:171-446(-)